MSSNNVQVQSKPFTSQLLQNDPEIKAILKQRFDTQMESLKAELEAVEAERAGLEDGETTEAPVAKKASKAKKVASAPKSNGTGGAGRPAGSSPKHGEAIKAVLTKTADLTLGEIHAALLKKGHQTEKKIVAHYLNAMKNSKQVLTKGERPNTTYHLPKSAAKK